LKKYFVLSFYLKQELLIKGNPKNLRLGTSRSNKTIVLSEYMKKNQDFMIQVMYLQIALYQ